MNAAARLAGFGAVLVLVFAAAAFAGSRIDAHPGKPDTAQGAKPGMGGMAADHGERWPLSASAGSRSARTA